LSVKPYSRILALFVIFASVYAVALVFEDQGTISETSFVSAHTTLQLLSISASLSIFGIRWTAGRLTKNMQNIVIGGIFLTVGLLHLFHVLSFPGLLESSSYRMSEISVHFHAIARYNMIIALLVVAFLPFRKPASASDSAITLFGCIVFVLFFASFVMLRIASLPAIYHENGDLTQFGGVLGFTAVVLFSLGVIRYSHLGNTLKEKTYNYVAAGLLACLFAELVFALHSYAFDSVILLAYSFEFIGFLIFFFALLKESIAQPFEKLVLTRQMHDESQMDIKSKIKEIEDARSKARTHFDFMVHDVSNIISPIVLQAEMLMMDGGLTPQQERHVEKILNGARRGGTFVKNLKLLANAESVPPEAFVGIDLGAALLTTEEFVRETHPNKNVSTTYVGPVDTHAIAPGGEHIENVLHEILKNAVETYPGETVRFSIALKQVRKEGGKPYWQISITQHNHEFPPETLAEAKVIFDPKRGVCRGIASEFAFYVSIVSHFGGRLWVDNLRENGKKSSRVTIELPKVKTDMM